MEVSVHASRVLHIFQHYFTIVQLRVTKPKKEQIYYAAKKILIRELPSLEQFKIADFLVSVVIELRQKPVSKKDAVLVDKQLLAAVYTDQHGNDI